MLSEILWVKPVITITIYRQAFNYSYELSLKLAHEDFHYTIKLLQTFRMSRE